MEASATPASIVNAGFETPKIQGYVANPPNAAWTFTPATGNNGSGLTQNGSGYTGSNPGRIPEGEQAAFLQGTGTISQTLGGLTPGADLHADVLGRPAEQFQPGRPNVAGENGRQSHRRVFTTADGNGLRRIHGEVYRHRHERAIVVRRHEQARGRQHRVH